MQTVAIILGILVFLLLNEYRLIKRYINALNESVNKSLLAVFLNFLQKNIGQFFYKSFYKYFNNELIN
jgi:hypothetical protein